MSSVRPRNEEEVKVLAMDQDGDEEFGERKTKRMPDPRLPSREEQEEHALTHVPFRSWCRHCVRGRAEECGHFKKDEEVRGVEVHMDYCFPGDEDEDFKLTILVARERGTRMTMSSVAPSKTTGEFMARRVVAFMREVGADQGDIVIKCDQEPAMASLTREIGAHRAAGGGARMVVESSPVGDSKGNGVIERAVKSVQGQVRVLRSALEERIGAKLDPHHAVFPWMVEYASLMLNRFEVGRDGRTAYERNKQKKAKTSGMEFGEAVLWKRKASGGNLGKLTCLWEDGVYLGIKATTGEIVIGTKKGIWRTRSVRRKPIELRWKTENMEMVGGVPWRMSEDDEKVDGEGLRGGVVRFESAGPMREEEKEEVRRSADAIPPRTFSTSTEDYNKHGFTQKCAGCRAILTGTTRQKHSEACRMRMTNAMAGEEKVKNAKRRRQEFARVVLEAEGQPSEEEERARKEMTKDEGMMVEEEQASSSSSGAMKRQGEEREEEEEKPSKRAKEGAESTTGSTKRGSEGEGDEDVPSKRAKEMEKEIGELDVNQEEEDCQWAVDDRNGELLDVKMVKEARSEEVKFMEELGVWERSSLEECRRLTGKDPVSTRWVDIDKGRDGEVLVRSRLVARDFKTRGGANDFDVFAAMPPLEAKRMLIRMSRVNGAVRGDPHRGRVKLMFVDVKKAHLNGRLKEGEHAFVELPSEAGGGVGKLKRWLYGMRPAASAWEDDYVEYLIGKGFRRGRSAPTVLYHEGMDIRLVVWGDDFTFLGRDMDLRWIAKVMEQRYEIKVRAMLGPDAGDDKEVRILNRLVRWEKDRIVYEGDEKHAQVVIREMGLEEGSKGFDIPVLAEKECTEGKELDAAGVAKYRRLAATVNYLAMDRPDLQFAASVLGRSMSRPTENSMAALKRAARYLLKHPSVRYIYQSVDLEQAKVIEGFSDSDWAGCRATRRSMSGGVVSIAGGTVKSWSNRQGSVALSSGEAEYYASVKTASELLGLRALAEDLGWGFDIWMWVDSTAAKSIASRLGNGKLRHLDVRFLWLQEATRDRSLRVKKIEGKKNPADILTKSKSFGEACEQLGRVGIVGP